MELISRGATFCGTDNVSIFCVVFAHDYDRRPTAPQLLAISGGSAGLGLLDIPGDLGARRGRRKDEAAPPRLIVELMRAQCRDSLGAASGWRARPGGARAGPVHKGSPPRDSGGGRRNLRGGLEAACAKTRS